MANMTILSRPLLVRTMRETEVMNPKIFDGLTAWFSCSVQHKKKKLWLDNDGEEASVDEAMFVFSENSDAEDTKKLYRSPTYINDSLAIFHASYIDECIDCGDMKKVTVGKYFLPPSDVYKKIERNVKYCYEYVYHGEGEPQPNRQPNTRPRRQCNNQSSIQPDTQPNTRHSTQSGTHNTGITQVMKENGCNGKSSSQDPYSEYVKIETIKQVPGPISDFIPGQHGCQVQKVCS